MYTDRPKKGAGQSPSVCVGNMREGPRTNMLSSVSLQLRQCKYSRFRSHSEHVHIVWRRLKGELVSERCDFLVTFQGHIALSKPTSYSSLIEHGWMGGIGP